MVEMNKRASEASSAPQIVIITGLSGSGMSSATNAFEDLGYFCVDNLPLTLLPTFARLVRENYDERPKIERAALVINIREREFLNEFNTQLEKLRRRECASSSSSSKLPTRRCSAVSAKRAVRIRLTRAKGCSPPSNGNGLRWLKSAPMPT